MSSLKLTLKRPSQPWISLVEGDEQPDRPNSQMCMECFHGYAA